MKIPPSDSLSHFDFYEPLPIQVEVSDIGDTGRTAAEPVGTPDTGRDIG